MTAPTHDFNSSVTAAPDSALTAAVVVPTSPPPHGRFVPRQPQSLAEAQLDEQDVVPLILKFLYLRGSQTGHAIAQQLKLNIAIVEPLLTDLRRRMLVGYRGSALANDYIYQLTPEGIEHAKSLTSRCSYCGAAPVSLEQYRHAVQQQSLHAQLPTFDEVRHSMTDLIMAEGLLSQVGQALHAGKSLLLYGDPGNGKTSIARRCIRGRRDTIWIPRTITISGEIVRLYDPVIHELVPAPASKSVTRDWPTDDRWVEIRRPTVIVGGELTMAHLEPNVNATTGIIEAPLHLKSNGGCLVIDDFGRQRIRPDELLNRWIVPLESGCDNLNLPTGRQIQIQFDLLLVFSTNLPPESLCDEAFLRRINYKVHVPNPSEEQMRKLFSAEASRHGIQLQPEAVDYLFEQFYYKHDRPMRFCHAADLVEHAKDHIEFRGEPPQLTPHVMDVAANNYFVGQ